MFAKMCLVLVYLGEVCLLADLALDIEDAVVVYWVLRESAANNVLDEMPLEITYTIKLLQAYCAILEDTYTANVSLGSSPIKIT